LIHFQSLGQNQPRNTKNQLIAEMFVDIGSADLVDWMGIRWNVACLLKKLQFYFPTATHCKNPNSIFDPTVRLVFNAQVFQEEL